MAKNTASGDGRASSPTNLATDWMVSRAALRQRRRARFRSSRRTWSGSLVKPGLEAMPSTRNTEECAEAADLAAPDAPLAPLAPLPLFAACADAPVVAPTAPLAALAPFFDDVSWRASCWNTSGRNSAICAALHCQIKR